MSQDSFSIAPFDSMDPYAREAQTNAVLTREQCERMAAFGVVEAVPAQALLFHRGERTVDFFVVIEGSVEIFDLDAHGHESVFVVHGPGQFTGELDLFNARKILVNARTREPSRVIRIRRPDFHRLMTAEPEIGEVIMRALILRRIGLIRHNQAGVVLLGLGSGADTLRIQSFLTRNNYPFRMIDAEVEKEALGFVDCCALTLEQLPVVIDPGQKLLKNPSNAELADALGMTEILSPEHVYDVVVVGAGPAGLAAAVYAASEGLDTLVIEGTAPGGQAGTSSKIENYLGFPTGISGQALAGRAQVQAQKFGARLAISRDVVALDCSRTPFRLSLEDGSVVSARAVVVATGARYRKLSVPNFERFEGQGIHYAATAMEASFCKGKEIAVVGAGNSAGQAAVYLSRAVRHVHMLCRGRGLADTMSSYLVERIAASPAITLHASTEITALDGEHGLETVTWMNRTSAATETRPIENVFAMIGAEPRTEWLQGCLSLDDKGFVVTGHARDGEPLTSPFETTTRGIFAVGDVRAGSVKRVASGVGEGSVVVQAIHRYLNPGLH
jgi:thioredoxin reductase (NADPH)